MPSTAVHHGGDVERRSGKRKQIVEQVGVGSSWIAFIRSSPRCSIDVWPNVPWAFSLVGFTRPFSLLGGGWSPPRNILSEVCLCRQPVLSVHSGRCLDRGRWSCAQEGELIDECQIPSGTRRSTSPSGHDQHPAEKQSSGPSWQTGRRQLEVESESYLRASCFFCAGVGCGSKCSQSKHLVYLFNCFSLVEKNPVFRSCLGWLQGLFRLWRVGGFHPKTTRRRSICVDNCCLFVPGDVFLACDSHV